MGKIATHQDVSNFAGGGTLPSDGNMCATKSWIESNFPSVGITGVYDANQLVQQQHLIKKDLEVTGVIVDGKSISLQKINPKVWGSTDNIEVEGMPFFTVEVNIANIGDKSVYPTCEVGGLDSDEFTPFFRQGSNDTATVLFQDFIRQPGLVGAFEAVFRIANEQSPNYSEIYAYVYLTLNFV